MKKVILIKHVKGAIGLRLLGLGPNNKPIKSLLKLQKFLNQNTFWAKDRNLADLKKCLANSDVILSIWIGNEIVGFGRALSDGIYRGVLWDVVIHKSYQGKGLGKMLIKNLLNSRKLKNTKKIYLMTTNKKYFYSQVDFKEVSSQKLLVREIKH